MNNAPQQTHFMSSFDPYVYQTLQTVVGKTLAVQTTRSMIQGVLKTVMPDHIVIEINNTPFFIRIAEIVWVSPS